MQTELRGNYQVWNFDGKTRKYADVNLTYNEAKELIRPVRYSALTGSGEQRATLDGHVRKLKSEILAGNYTPTQMSAGLHKKHRARLTLNEDEQTFVLPVDSSEPLSQTDGGHRYNAINSIELEIINQLAKAEDKEKPAIENRLSQLRNLPCGFRVYFDGNPKSDFINLQAGRPVDNSHMFSLKIQQQVTGDPSLKLAFNIAKCLHKDSNSPFHELIRFDSRANSGNLIKQIPISTLCAKGASDIGTSLIGLARVGLLFGCEQAETLAKFVTVASSVVSETGAIGQAGKALTPPRNNGSKGSATMLVGVGTCFAYRVLSDGRLTPNEDDKTELANAMTVSLDVEIDGNFSGVFKRRILGGFVRSYIKSGELHDGIPVQLLKTLSSSTFDAEALPRKKSLKKGNLSHTVTEQESVQVVEAEKQPEPVTAVAEPGVVLDEVATVTEEQFTSLMNNKGGDVAPWETELQS